MKFRKKYKKIIYWATAAVVILLLAALAIRRLRVPFSNFVTPPNRPAQAINSSEPVVAAVDFSNEKDSGSLAQTVIKEIDGAQKTLEIAMYSFKSVPIREAIYRANLRGVKVTMILDWRKRGEHDIFFGGLPSGIKRLDRGSSSALMHHKFALIDRGTPNLF